MSISCDEVLRKLDLYLDGELAEPESAALAEHLDACPECLAHETFEVRLREIVRTKLGATPDTPEALVDRIRRAVAGRQPLTF